ncbi:MAG: lysophospholipid acyltransferase family protein [Actinomycetes bacterium]
MADLVYPPVVVAIKTLWRYLGLKFTVFGEANIPRKGGAVLAINHVGYLDFAIAGTAALPVNRYVRFMAKKEIFDNKIAGPLMRGMHHISVDRSNGSASFVAALRALRAGEIVGIFPEATISRSFEIKDLKTGAVRLAMGSGVPIIPTIVWGSQRVYSKRMKRDFKRNGYPITVAFGEPLSVERGTDVDAAEIELKKRMVELLHFVQDRYPDSHVGQRWAPARLGGTAPTPEEAQKEHDEFMAKLKEKNNPSTPKKEDE